MSNETVSTSAATPEKSETSPMPAQPKRKQPREVPVEITRIANDGLGEGLFGEKRVSVRNGLPGEQVTTRILKRRKGRLYGDGVAVEGANTHRRPSSCAHFPRCGGCTLHHLDYEQQLEHKLEQLKQCLSDVALEPKSWLASVSTGQLGYRRKARLGVRWVGERVLVGFRESFSNRVADLSACVTLTPEISRLLRPLGELVTGLTVARKVPQIEVAQGEVGVRGQRPTLMLRHLEALQAQDIVALRDFEARYAVEILLQSGGYDTLVTLQGEPPSLLAYRLASQGMTLRFKPDQFIQVNLLTNQEMIRQALCLLASGSRALADMRVVDLFCGIGNFTLPIFRSGAQVSGFEAAASAVDMARDNACLNRQAAEFHVADLYTAQVPERLVEHIRAADALVLDPPRSGAGPNLEQWLEHFSGELVLYVSCNPSSFASDASVLEAAGLSLDQVGIFDMFPNTAHVETMGLFRRQNNHG